MVEPYRVLDVVELTDPDRDGPPAGAPMAVTQVRRYPDGSHRYVVASPGDENWVATIYRSDQVRATGERLDVGAFGIPGPVGLGDVVRVVPDYDEPELAGQEGQVEGWQGGERPVSVWFESLQEEADLEVEALVPTGRRVPRPEPAPYVVHQLVDGDGRSEDRGPLAFVVLDELDFYL